MSSMQEGATGIQNELQANIRQPAKIKNSTQQEAHEQHGGRSNRNTKRTASKHQSIKHNEWGAGCGQNKVQPNTVTVSRSLVAWLREFCRTLEIIARTLRKVVNRVRLCGHHTRGCSHGEVHVYGEVMRRWGE